jgi:hypothetical protein
MSRRRRYVVRQNPLVGRGAYGSKRDGAGGGEDSGGGACGIGAGLADLDGLEG